MKILGILTLDLSRGKGVVSTNREKSCINFIMNGGGRFVGKNRRKEKKKKRREGEKETIKLLIINEI